jgi:hypothetical protein
MLQLDEQRLLLRKLYFSKQHIFLNNKNCSSRKDLKSSSVTCIFCMNPVLVMKLVEVSMAMQQPKGNHFNCELSKVCWKNSLAW